MIECYSDISLIIKDIVKGVHFIVKLVFEIGVSH